MILVIDNYDSFTYNLVHLIGAHADDIVVERNDSLSVNEALTRAPDAIILSPGPCTPNEAGICVDLAKEAKEANIPLLGVCLGHQSIVQAAGGTIGRAGRLMHGRTSEVSHSGTSLFDGVPSPFTATRYHSLVAEPKSLPNDIEVMANATDDNEIMAVRWGDGPCWGVQFHPESIASDYGDRLITNFLSHTSPRKAAA